MDPDLFAKVVQTNLFGTFSTIKQAVTRLQNEGRIVNLSSTSLHMALPGYAAYNAAKAAIEAMTKVVAKEVAERGITANVVAPGPTSTELFFAGKSQETVDAMKAMSPFRRLGEVGDIAPVVTFLCRPESVWVSGQTIRANGGLA
jgi:3-oxoacyl-[acyl-carrier protein] reductase